MSIASELTLLNNTKQGIKTAINNKGVTVTNEPFAEYPDKIMQIQSGGYYETNIIDYIEGTSYYIELNTNITRIRDMEFFGFRNLRKIDIPDTVTYIGKDTFFNCTSMTEIIIGSGILTLDDAAFGNCWRATSITIKATTPPTLGVSVFQNTTCKIFVPANSLLDYQVAWSSLADRIEPIHS